MISFFLSIIYLSKGVTNSSVIFELPFTRVLVIQGAEADAGDDRYDSVITDFVYMKVALVHNLYCHNHFQKRVYYLAYALPLYIDLLLFKNSTNS